MKDIEDAYGHALLDQLESKKRGGSAELDPSIGIPVERDDGMIDVHPAYLYFTTYEEWPEHQRQAMAFAQGRVLDIGCGAGRHSLYLQQQGLDVVAIDTSPMAIQICKRMGVRATQMLSITQVSGSLGIFDTVLMLGNNFGLLENQTKGRRLLKRLYDTTTPDARIIAETLDPYEIEDPFHFEYHQQNRQRGRLPGQVRIRVRYRKYRTPWFDYLLVSREEMGEIVGGTGWEISRFLDSGGSLYIGILEKEGHK